VYQLVNKPFDNIKMRRMCVKKIQILTLFNGERATTMTIWDYYNYYYYYLINTLIKCMSYTKNVYIYYLKNT